MCWPPPFPKTSIETLFSQWVYEILSHPISRTKYLNALPRRVTEVDVFELDLAAAPSRILAALGVDVDVRRGVDGGEDDRGRPPRHREDLDVGGGLPGGRRADQHGEEHL